VCMTPCSPSTIDYLASIALACFLRSVVLLSRSGVDYSLGAGIPAVLDVLATTVLKYETSPILTNRRPLP
jgi:hypothetical protein